MIVVVSADFETDFDKALKKTDWKNLPDSCRQTSRTPAANRNPRMHTRESNNSQRRNKNIFYFQPHLCCLFSSSVHSPFLVPSFQTHLPPFSLTSFPSLYCCCCFFPPFLLSLSLSTFNSTPYFLLQSRCGGAVSMGWDVCECVCMCVCACCFCVRNSMCLCL